MEGLEEGPQAPKVDYRDIQPSLKLEDIPSDDDDDGSVDYANVKLLDIESDEDDDGSVDYDSVEGVEVDIDTYNYKKSIDSGDFIAIPKSSSNKEFERAYSRKLSAELETAGNRYLDKVLPITNADGAENGGELTPIQMIYKIIGVREQIKDYIKEGPDGERYFDIKGMNSAIKQFYADINKSYSNIARKNSHQFKPIERRVEFSREFTSGFENYGDYLSSKDQTEVNKQLKTEFPATYDGKDSSFSVLEQGLGMQDPLNVSPIKGYREHTRTQEYKRLLQDEDLKSSLGRTIAEQFRIKGIQSKTDIGKYFLDEKEFDDLASRDPDADDNSTSESRLRANLVDWSLKILAMKTVNGFNPKQPAQRYFINKSKDTIIELPEGSDRKIRPDVNMDYIQAATEAIDRSVRPDKSKIVRKINFKNTDDYPGEVLEGELAHTNFATLQINVFMDRISNLNDIYNAAPIERKDELIRKFASPNAWDSMESLYKYTVAHELGHIMAAVIWDHEELNSNSYKKGPPTWRFRKGLPEMQKEVNPLKQMEPVSKYGEESTDEYWAEAYAKWLVDDEASPAFKKLLDDYGLIRGKARRWVTDEASTNPAGRGAIPDSAVNALENLQKMGDVSLTGNEYGKNLIESEMAKVPYLGEYGEEETKDQLKNIVKILELSPMGTDNKPAIFGMSLLLTRMNENWNGTSNYTSGIATMYALREEFDIQNGLPLTGRATADENKFAERKKVVEQVDAGFKQNPEALKLFKQILRANYNITQKVLADRNITELILYRGWRNAEDMKNAVVVPSRPINSFSLEEDIARRFLGSQGTMTATIVPREDIWSFFKILKGGVANEAEVLLLGGAREMYAYPWNAYPRLEDIVGTGKEVLID